jgi:dienelactone hydrolase
MLTFLSFAQEPCRDTRGETLRDPDHFELRIKPVENLREWEARKQEIRMKLLLCAGLLPEPRRTPLNARIFDERRGDGFTVAKVYFESLPGFLVTGNLYRPTRGTPPYPAVISPHGHWEYGRLNNTDLSSIPGRCIDFARMGFVVFSIDMIGYNDSMQFPHTSGSSRSRMNGDKAVDDDKRLFHGEFDFPEAELYGFSLGGLQLWNNIRAVDFLVSLPDVDPSRIGATGASGGATQTLFLMTADDRIKVAAPVNIIGAAKHPGCRCENMSGLWIETSTVEMCAAFSPKPLLLMSATEDPWTDKTPEREYPMIQRYYSFYQAEDMIKNVHITGGHNYNAETRAAVYEWFCSHLKSEFPPIQKPASVALETKKLGDLRVFPDNKLHDGALQAGKIIANWKAESEKAFLENVPASTARLGDFATTYGGFLRQLLSVEEPSPNELTYRSAGTNTYGGAVYETGFLGRSGKGDCIGIESVSPNTAASAGVILMVYPENRGGLVIPEEKSINPWISTLVERGYTVCRVSGYASGRTSIPLKRWDSFSLSATYNRDNRLNGIQDIVTALAYIGEKYPASPVNVVGLEECGLPAAFACAVAQTVGRVVIDLNGSDPGYDHELLNLLPVGGIKRLGDFRAAMLILMRKRVTLFDAGVTFDSAWYTKQAGILGLGANLDLRLNEEKIVLPDQFK